jgi:4'-phosphopantetheinyl transferase
MGQRTWADLGELRSGLGQTGTGTGTGGGTDRPPAGLLPAGLLPGGLVLLPVPAALPPEQLALLDAEERQRMAAFHREADRVRYGFAHLVLRLVLGGLLGRPADTLRFGRAHCPCCGGPHGRPVLAGPGERCEFSLSHGGDLVMVGAAALPVGVDVEPVPSAASVTDLAPMLHPAEQRGLALSGGGPAAFARLWTRKEAYLKGLGTGLGRALDQDDLTGSPPGWRVTDVTAADGHAAAVAVAEAPPPGPAPRTDPPKR